MAYLALFLLPVSITLIVLAFQRSKTGQKNKMLSMTFLILGCGALVALVGIGAHIFRGLLSLGYVDSAIISIGAVGAGEAKFAAAHPEIGYTCKLSELPSDELIAGIVANQQKNRYLLELTGCQAEGGKGPKVKYLVTVRPLHAGMPALCSDQTGVRKYDSGGSPERCVQAGTPF